MEAEFNVNGYGTKSTMNGVTKINVTNEAACETEI